jgi:dienelactone hydrolase
MASELGYIAFAADIYGADLQTNLTMDQRVELATLYRSNATLFASRIQAAIDTVLAFNYSNNSSSTSSGAVVAVDPDRMALAGYCFGGTGVLTYALAPPTTHATVDG